MGDSDGGGEEFISEVGLKGPPYNEKPNTEHSAINFFSNMENLLSRILNKSETQTVSTSHSQFIQFNPDDSDADIEGWCRVTEMIVHKKKT